MKYSHLIALALLVAPLTACVSIGANYDEAAVAKLTPGMDETEVIAMLGRPTTTVRLTDGTQHVAWTYSHGSMFGAHARSLTLLFGPDGKYRQIVSEAQTEIK